MYRQQHVRSVVVCAAVAALMVSGCRRAEEAVPVTEFQSEHFQQTSRPMTVAGCLKAGEAANTFVLSVERAEGAGESATYELIASPADFNFRDHVGEQVRVSGVLEARQTATAQTVAQPADTGNGAPTGTAGTPTVQTQTQVKINVFTVESLEPLGGECGIGI